MDDSLYELLIKLIRSEQANVFTAMPARVISFNGHTVTCEVMINRTDDKGKDLVIPPLVDVPVQFPHQGVGNYTRANSREASAGVDEWCV